MKLTMLVLVPLFILSGCSSFSSLREQRLACVERFIEKGVDAVKARNVCQWGFELQ